MLINAGSIAGVYLSNLCYAKKLSSLICWQSFHYDLRVFCDIQLGNGSVRWKHYSVTRGVIGQSCQVHVYRPIYLSWIDRQAHGFSLFSPNGHGLTVRYYYCNRITKRWTRHNWRFVSPNPSSCYSCFVPRESLWSWTVTMKAQQTIHRRYSNKDGPGKGFLFRGPVAREASWMIPVIGNNRQKTCHL